MCWLVLRYVFSWLPQGWNQRKCCKVACSNVIRAFHNAIIHKKKSVHSATRISGYCKTIFLIFVLQPPGHVYINSNLQIYVTASRILISIWEDNSQVAVFHIVQVLNICKTCKDSMLIQWPLSAAHSYPRQETWKKKKSGMILFSFYKGAATVSLCTDLKPGATAVARRGQTAQQEKLDSLRSFI